MRSVPETDEPDKTRKDKSEMWGIMNYRDRKQMENR